MTATVAASRSKKSARPSASSSGPSAAGKRFGSVTPRLWTRPLRELTPATSLGFEAVEFADWVRNRLEEVAVEREEPELLDLFPRLLEWQRWFLIHALEILPGTLDVFRFRIVLLLVARQNGKTAVIIALMMWRLFHDRARTVLGTAQSLEIASDAWGKVAAISEAIPELADEVARITQGKSDKSIELDTGSWYKIASANRRGGRGFSGECVVMDELREHQSWHAWSAASNTTLAKPRGQVFGVSNAGDRASIVLRHLREVALAALEERAADLDGEMDVDSETMGIFEWSAPDDIDVRDRDGWYSANPSLGHTITERSIATALAGPEVEFRTEVLCQWVNAVGVGPFPNGSWEATRVETVTRDTSRTATYCLDVSFDRTWSSIALAFWDTEGRRRVELAAHRPGTEWIVGWFLSPKRRITPEHITLQSRGAPATSMLGELERAGLTVTPWEGAELGVASGVFFDAMRLAVDEDDPRLTLTHGMQQPLDVAAVTAKIKPLGDGWGIDRKGSLEDAAPLVAAMGAVWLLNTNPESTGSAYDDEDASVLVF
jgi:hypothetical protein